MRSACAASLDIEMPGTSPAVVDLSSREQLIGDWVVEGTDPAAAGPVVGPVPPRGPTSCVVIQSCDAPGPDGTPQLPCDPQSGRVVPDVWDKWLAWDPVRMAARHGYVFYISPGPLPGMNTGYWGPPIRIGVPQPAITPAATLETYE